MVLIVSRLQNSTYLKCKHLKVRVHSNETGTDCLQYSNSCKV